MALIGSGKEVTDMPETVREEKESPQKVRTRVYQEAETWPHIVTKRKEERIKRKTQHKVWKRSEISKEKAWERGEESKAAAFERTQAAKEDAEARKAARDEQKRQDKLARDEQARSDKLARDEQVRQDKAEQEAWKRQQAEEEEKNRARAERARKIAKGLKAGETIGRGVVKDFITGAAPRVSRQALPRGITTKGYLPGPAMKEALTPQFGPLREATKLSGAGLRSLGSPSRETLKTAEESVYGELLRKGGGATKTEVMESGEIDGFGKGQLGKALSTLTRIGAIRIRPEFGTKSEPYYEVEER